jgi:hypothetical protein
MATPPLGRVTCCSCLVMALELVEGLSLNYFPRCRCSAWAGQARDTLVGSSHHPARFTCIMQAPNGIFQQRHCSTWGHSGSLDEPQLLGMTPSSLDPTHQRILPPLNLTYVLGRYVATKLQPRQMLMIHPSQISDAPMHKPFSLSIQTTAPILAADWG